MAANRQRREEDTKSGSQAEKALRESERRLLDILDNSTALIYIKDTEGRYLLINRQYETLFHVTREQVAGKTDHDLFPPTMADAFRANDRRVLAAGTPMEFEEVASQDDGPHTYISIKFPLYDSTGDVCAVCGISTDITERKRAEQALREARAALEARVAERTAELEKADVELRAEVAERRRAEEEYRTIVRTAMDGFWIADTQGHLLNVNEAYCRLVRYRRDELLKMRIQDVEAMETPEETVRHIRRVMETGSDRFETRHRRKDGGIIDLEVSVNYLGGNGGRLFAFLRDIGQRKRAEQALRESEERYRTLAEAAQDMIYVVNRKGYVEYINSFAARQFGMRPEEILGRRRDTLFPREVSDRQWRNLRKVFQTKNPMYIEEKTSFPDRERWLGTWLVPIEDKAGVVRAVMGISRDITERTELDRLKDEFITVAAHELKTPVAIMKGYAQALLRSPEEVSPPRRRMLEAIDRGANRIDAIVKDLLDISKLHAGHLELDVERIDLPALVAEVVDRMALTTTKHRIQVVSAESVVVHGDRDRLEQVLMNLLDNAIKYSPQGGKIDVAVAVRSGNAVVAVRDYGVGIPKEKQARIFQRFYSAHTGTPFDYGGMGVGLYISREIITRHGGTVWFESEEGRGSTFHFSLPLRVT